MIKRILPILISFISLLPAGAQLATGSWRQYPVFGEFTGLADTGRGAIWYVTGNCLYCYDEETDETRFYQGGRELSDFNVKFIKYNPEKDMLLVAYQNGNMDMILSDGQRVNLPEIKDAVVNIEKSVNDVTFDGDEMFVAAGFGIVVYDLNRLEVKESGIYNRDIGSVIVTPTHIVIAPSAYDSEYLSDLYILDRTRPVNNFDNYRLIDRYYHHILSSEPLDEERTQFAVVRNGYIGAIHISPDGSLVSHTELDPNLRISSLVSTPDGTVRFITSDGRIGRYVDKSKFEVDEALPAQFAGNMMSTVSGLSSVWLADASGLGHYRIAQDGSMTVLRDKSVPSDAISFSEVCNIFPVGDGPEFLVSNLGSSQNHPVGEGDRFNVKLGLNRFSRSGFEVINPTDVPAYSSSVVQQQNVHGKYIMSPTMTAVDPDNDRRYYIGSGGEGLYVVENNEVIGKIDSDNAPLNKLSNRFWGTEYVDIDPQGNLWVGSRGKVTDNRVIMLPAAKRKLDPSAWNYSDWVIADYGDILNSREIRMLHCRNSNMSFGFDSDGNSPLLAVNTKGTRGDVSDDEWSLINPVDQDGKSYSPTNWICMTEDKRGHVWIGSTSGVISITNPSRALDSDFRINHIKVPRTDGSGLADYLLESDKVVDIAVDNSNRKWIATEDSGLYLVSEDGDRIISTFTTSNSPLPSNTITALYADPESNSIFVGTLAGLYEYSSTSGPARPDYSDVIAYPNPVTPDYSGWITIAGLMNSSMVKIVDSTMHLVYQTTSEGGTALWDGCDMRGARVRSGVYYVLASAGGESSYGGDSSSAGDVVAKILVVN